MDHLAHLRLRHRLPDTARVGVISAADVKAETDRDKRDIVVVATTSELDLDNEVVLASGADTSYFELNGSIFADHQYDRANYVGKVSPDGAKRRKIYPIKSNGDVVGWNVRFYCTRNELGDEILRQAREDGIGVSIGFQALEWSPPSDEEKARWPEAINVIRRWKWLELSVTQLPCNVNARQVGDEPLKSAGTAITFEGDIAIVETAKGVELVM